jgi:TetR/AcrR family transcriptional regulator, transcriptional repressor for nem operon
MTNSRTKASSDKRGRLVASAAELVYRQGIERPTLAQIAEAADVPQGNVYYYFKTKDELIEAVIECRATEVRDALASFERRRTPAARLKALARNWFEFRDVVAAQGCPLGTLAIELNDHGDGLDQQAAKLFAPLIEWSETQFRELGVRDPREHAITLISTVQGAALLTSTLSDSGILGSQVHRLERWIDSLARAS